MADGGSEFVLSEKYWPCTPREELGGKLWSEYQNLLVWPHINAAKWWAAMSHYYGDDGDAGAVWTITRRGPEGEITALRVPRNRALLKARVALITSSRIEWRARASKSSAGADEAATIGQELLYDAWRNGEMSTLDLEWTEQTEVLSESYVFAEWDRTRGPRVFDGESKVAYRGDVRLNLLPPWMVLSDPSRTAYKDQDWWFITTVRPKADLVMLHKKVLLNGAEVDGNVAAHAIWDCDINNQWWRPGTNNGNELELNTTPLVHFIHRPTLALPLGRHVGLLNGETVLFDKPLVGKNGDYKVVPLVRMASEERIGTPTSWAAFWDTFGAQQMADNVDTQAASITSLYGTPSLVLPTATKIDENDAVMGLRTIRTDGGAKDVAYTKPPELEQSYLEWKQGLSGDQQSLLGLNDASLGQSDSAEKNAQADALAASMAVQQAGPAVLARRQALSKLGHVFLTTLQQNVDDERVLHIVGKGEKNLVEDTKKWTGSSLGPIDSVEVEEVSPLEATQQGRFALLEFFSDHGWVLSPEDVSEVVMTGRLTGAINPVRDEEILIRIENEMLSSGKVPPITATQNQPLHYRKNAAVLLSITAQQNPDIMKAVLATLDKRYELYYGVAPITYGPDGKQVMAADPLLLPRRRFLLGQGPDPMPPMPGAPGAPPPSGGDAGGAPALGGEPSPGAPSAPGTPMVDAPKNPLTGDTFSNSTPPLQ